jgi:NDP-sugar pyrophosphorylase family protein
LKDKIIQHFSPRGKYFLFSEEDTPLGTGGAIKNAEPLIRADQLLILNGDSLCQIDHMQFCEAHFERQALLSMVLTFGKDSQDYGKVILDKELKIVSFQEKEFRNEEGLINAGIYLMQKKGLALMPSSFPFSLEYDFFPNLVQNHKCFGWVVENEVLDIGTPRRYQRINQLMEQ